MNLRKYLRLLPKRPLDANKGTFGKVMIVAGSVNYPGSAILAGEGAMRAGVGLVTLAIPKIIYPIVASNVVEATYLIREAEGAVDEIVEKMVNYSAVVVGPGLGQDAINMDAVRKILIWEKLPKVVLDADGLNILAQINAWSEYFRFEGVLTPHPGEMARLLKISVEEVQSNRKRAAELSAKKWNKVVVLKGAETVIASPDGRIEKMPFKNPVLATAGTGDILAGMIGGFLAQGMPLFEGAVLGAYIHGKAGENMRRDLGEVGYAASTLLPEIPRVIRKMKA